MRHTYIAAGLLIALAALPLLGQRTVRVRSVSGPEMFEFDSQSSHSYLGVGVADLSSDRVQALKLKDDHGVEITQVDQDAPAGKAGLKEHDVIVSFNGTAVESLEQFKRLMRETPPGRTVSLDIVRDGQQQNVKVQLADRKKLESSVFPHEHQDFAVVMPPMPPMPAMPAFPRSWPDTLIRVRSNSGATLESLSPQLGDYFGVKNGEGLLVRSVQKGSPADQAGLRAGDVIVRVGDQRITDNSDWRQALRSSKDGKVALVIMRDRKEQTLSLAVPPRRGADSSALYQNNECPDVDDTARALEEAGADAEMSIQSGLNAAGSALNNPEISESINKAMQELHRELAENNGELNRTIRNSMNAAASELQAHGDELQRAMQEASRRLEKMRDSFADSMQ